MRLSLPLLSIALLFYGLPLYAQSPPGINYQGVARNLDGKPLVLKDITIKISIAKDAENGEVEYAEVHTLKTNSFGLFTLVIGNGSAVVGDFRFVSWAMGNKWLRVEMDPEGGNSFQIMGSQQFMSVPYAFYSKYSGNSLTAGQGIQITNGVINNTGDGDNSSSNEWNTAAALEGRKLKITDGGGTKEVDLSPLAVSQTLGGVLTLGNDAGGQPITNLPAPVAPSDAATKAYVDGRTANGDMSNTNEIQDLTLSANKLTITGNPAATEINLAPYLDNTDAQSLTFSGSTLSISGGNSVNLGALGVDAQNLSSTSSGTNRTISITNGTSTTIDVADNDNSSTNEIQDLSLTANSLALSGDATPVSLAPYLDNTDSQNLSVVASGTNRTINISGGTGISISVADDDNNATNELQSLSYVPGTKSLSISGGNTVTIPETQNLSQVLSQGTDAGGQKIVNMGAPTSNADAATKKYVDDGDALLASRIATNYAFKASFSYTNSTSLATNDVVMPFVSKNFDDFNVVGPSTFTAAEAGTYVFMVDGSYSALLSGGQLSILYNGVKYPVAIVQPWGGVVARFNATLMFRLAAGQTVSLVGDNVLAGGVFNGSFFGYRL